MLQADVLFDGLDLKCESKFFKAPSTLEATRDAWREEMGPVLFVGVTLRYMQCV